MDTTSLNGHAVHDGPRCASVPVGVAVGQRPTEGVLATIRRLIVGFADQSRFARGFDAISGETPSASWRSHR